MFNLKTKAKQGLAAVSTLMLSAGAFAQATLPTGVQDAIDNNIDTVELVAAAMLAIPLAFLGIQLVKRAIKSH